MTTAITRREIPPPTPQVAASLSPQELREHRARIAFEVEVVLSTYFQPNEAEHIKAGQLAFWCDVLQDWTVEQVCYALRRWNGFNPDKRPTPGHISAMLREIRGRKEAERMAMRRRPEPQRDDLPKMTAERAAEITAAAGIRLKTFGASND